MHAMDKHEEKNYSYEFFLKKGPKKRFGHHSLRWFLVVPPKDGFSPW
jgi:hypothetical protein